MTQAFLRANRRTFTSLRKYRNYRLFFSGQVVSVSGTWMQNIATAWLILSLTHSPVAVGVLALCQFLPFSIFGLFSGVLVDRFDPRKTVIATQAVSLVFAAVLAGLTLGGIVEPWQVYLLSALRGAVLVVDAPARQALTFSMVGRDELPNAVALNSSLFNAARVIGPAAGGIVVAVAGVGFCFAFNAASFFAVLAGLLLMRKSEMFPVERAETAPTLLGGTREALALRRAARKPLVVLVLVCVVSTFAFNFNVLLPVLAKQTLGGGPGDVRRPLRRASAPARWPGRWSRPRSAGRAGARSCSGRPASGSRSCCSRPSARSPRRARCSSSPGSASRSGRRTRTRRSSSPRRTRSAGA